MSTRRAPEGAPLHDNRFMSDPDYVEMRGISGTAVAAKAGYVSERKRRSLLFFIQSLSIQQQGTKRLANELLRIYPERIGTPAMHKFGMKKGQVYSADQVKAIRAGLSFAKKETGYMGRQEMNRRFPLKGEHVRASAYLSDEDGADSKREAEAQKHPASYPASVFVDLCRKHIEAALPDFLVSLCVDPKLEIFAEGETDAVYDRIEIIADDPRLTNEDFSRASLPGFRDIVGALFDYQQRYEGTALREFAMTSIAKEVFGALDYGLKTGKMILIEGQSGAGKTTAIEAWCDAHRGVARYVRLKGINGRRAFFGKVAQAIGVGCTAGLSPEKIQARVDRFLETSRLMLVIDEGQYLWPQGIRIHRHPELINWLDTACANEGVPVAIVATDEFGKQRRKVEAQTTWESFQLRRRLRRVFQLPAVPTDADLELVARKLLPDGAKPIIQLVVGYAKASGGYMQAVVDVIGDAGLLADEAGRSRVTAEDIKRAVGEWRAPSDAAQKRVFAPEPFSRRSRRSRAAVTPQGLCSDAAESTNGDNLPLGDMGSSRVRGHDLAGAV